MDHFFNKKIPYNLTIFNFRKWINYYQIQQYFYKNFILENVFLMASAIEEFIFKNQKQLSCGKYFLWTNDSWFIGIAYFFEIW